MNAFQKKIGWRVLGIHVAIVLFVIVSSLMHGCFRSKPKEIAMFVEFGDPAPQVEVMPVSQMAAPEPPAPDPEPPAPAPKPAPIPEPVKSKPKPKPKPKPVPKPKPKEPVKPKKKKYTAPKDIKLGKKVNEQPAKPSISSADIKKAMSGISSSSTATPNQFNAYDAQVFRIFYGAWSRPGTPGARPATVRISLLKNGRITGRALIQDSGDLSFDRTVMDAVNRVSILPKPPAGYPDNFVVRFSIID